MTFNDNEHFLRRILPQWFNFDTQEIQSWAFANHPLTPDRMSINWEKLSSVKQTAVDPGSGVASITAKVCYQENQDIEHTPQEDNPSHCDVVGLKNKTIQRRLRNAAVLRLAPKNPANHKT